MEHSKSTKRIPHEFSNVSIPSPCLSAWAWYFSFSHTKKLVQKASLSVRILGLRTHFFYCSIIYRSIAVSFIHCTVVPTLCVHGRIRAYTCRLYKKPCATLPTLQNLAACAKRNGAYAHPFSGQRRGQPSQRRHSSRFVFRIPKYSVA